MFRRVTAILNWEIPSKQETFKNDLSNLLENISCYDKNVSHGEDMEGNPQSRIDIRPEEKSDGDELFSFIKDKMKKIPVLTGRLYIHDCKHDEGTPFESCQIEKSFKVK